MAALPPSSQLSRTRSGRLPASTQLIPGAAPRLDRHARPAPTGSSTASTGSSTSSSTLFTASNISVFLTNLRLLDFDRRPDWPDITAQTFSGKDQKRRIQSVEWSLYHLFCLWDPEEAQSKMRPYFPPADQLQSVNLRAALLRGLEKAKKTGALGRDAILRKTMLDECRGERMEEILAVFSSAVLKVVVAADDDDDHTHPAYARALALESRGYTADRAELHALLLAHKASLHALLRQKTAARAQYQDFAELLGLKERSLARREVAIGAETAEHTPLSHDTKLDLWRLVRNNWSGAEPWMEALLYGGDDQLRCDTLLSTDPDRVWRRVRAGRLGELESRGAEGGLLEQLEQRAQAQQARVQHWEAYRRRVFGDGDENGPPTAAAPSAPLTSGIDLGFGAHESLRPGRTVTKKDTDKLPPADNTEYADLLQGLEAELDGLSKPARSGQDLLATLFPTRKRDAAAAARRAADEEDLSDISDMDEHLIAVKHVPPAISTSVPGSPLLGVTESPGQSPGPSPSRPRVLLTKKSLTFSVKAHRHESDEEEELPQRRVVSATVPSTATTAPGEPEADEEAPPRPRSLRRRPQRTRSPPIRPRANTNEALRAARTPSPSPPPDDDDVDDAAVPYSTYHTPTPTRMDGAYDNHDSPRSPSGQLADQILASMQDASPSPVKVPPPRPRHTLSLAERTRLTMAHAGRGGGSGRGSGRDSLAAPARGAHETGRTVSTTTTTPDDDDSLVARTRKSMAAFDFEAAQKKADLERRRSLRHSRQSSVGTTRPPPRRESVSYTETTVVLTEELMTQQDDAEAIFRSRPRIALSPIPSPGPGGED